MAINDNQPRYGFRWFQPAGGEASPQPLPYNIASGLAPVGESAVSCGLSIGDPVKMVSTGTIDLAIATQPVYGIIAGFGPLWNASQGVMIPTDYYPSGTAPGTPEERQSTAWVIPVTWGLWEIDVNDNITATTAAAYRAFIFENCSHICTVANDQRGRAAATPKLNISTHATTAGLIWRIMGISPNQDNRDFSATGVKLIVAANVSQMPGQAATTIAGV